MEREKLIATVTAAQQGDSDALSDLFNAFYNDVYYFALKTVKDEDLACDITQETFIEVIKTIGKLREPAAFVGWMRRIVYHQCTRYFDKKKDVLVEEDEEGNSIFDTAAEDKTEFIPDEALDKKDFRETILSILDTLSEEQRSAVLLYYYDEMSVGQIAEIQGVSEGTVKSRLNYARKSIKKSVESYEKKSGIRLHSVGILPLLLWLLQETGKETMSAAAANAVAGGVTAATGTTVVAATGSAAAATAATATAATAAATATTASAASAVAGTGIIAKLAALPIVTKVVAGVAAVSVVTGGVGAAILVENIPAADAPTAVVTTVAGTSATPSASTPAQVPPATTAPTADTVCYVPDGYTYTTANGTTLTAGQAMPAFSSFGDILASKEYSYTYRIFDWKVTVNDKTRSTYSAILPEINHQPVTDMWEAFAGCTNLQSAPAIPESVTELTGAFQNCTSLVTPPVIPEGVTSLFNTFLGCSSLATAPVIPKSVTSMTGTFMRCPSLTGTIEIHANPATHINCFALTSLPIALTGTSTMLDALAATATNGNVKLEADMVYTREDMVSSIERIESWSHNWPDFGESQTAMTQFGRNYIIAVSETPVCRVRSVEIVSASVDGVACEIYQTTTKEKALAIAQAHGAAGAVETEILTVAHILSPELEMHITQNALNVLYEYTVRITLENGQVEDFLYSEATVSLGTGGILTDCTPEDFQ